MARLLNRVRYLEKLKRMQQMAEADPAITVEHGPVEDGLPESDPDLEETVHLVKAEGTETWYSPHQQTEWYLIDNSFNF